VIHGQFFGQNIMLRPRNAGARIAVIDWETAALGPPAFDLVSITSGHWTDAEQSAMRRAYFEQYQGETGQVLNWDAFCGELHGVASYQMLEWLVWWGPHRSVEKRLKRFQRYMRRLEALLRIS
jgi:aminoglycoside phosphotransferase (APT) family kinase protein